MSLFAIEIEKMWDVFQERSADRRDTIGFQALVDSIAKEGNWEKTEYARYISLTKTCDLNLSNSGKNCYEELAPVVSRFRSWRIKTHFKFMRGESFCVGLDFSRGMDLMLEAVSESKAMGHKEMPSISGLFYILANRYYHFRNYRKAIDFAILSEQYMGAQKSLGAHNTVALAYQQLGRFDLAEHYYKVTMQKAFEYQQPVWAYIAMGNLGRVYCLQKRYKEGIPLLFTELVKDSVHEKVNAAISALYIAEAYLEQKQRDSAGHYLQLGYQIYTAQFPQWSKLYYSSKFCHYYQALLSQWYQQNGNYPEALRWKDTSIFNEKRFNSQLDWKFLTSAEKRIEGLEYQQSLTLLQSKQKAEWLQKILLAVVLASVIVIGGLFINRQRLKHKKEQELASEREAYLQLQEQQARKELEEARQQLDEFMKGVEQRRQYRDDIAAELAAFQGSAEMIKAEESITRRLAALANTTLLTSSDWQSFQERFEKVYPGFFGSLRVAIPDVTPAEERLLALLKLNSSNRQMAAMLGISPESVRTARYRLRKKLVAGRQTEWLSLLNEPQSEMKSS